MPWCFEVPPQWVGSNGPLSYGISGGGYTGNGNGQFTGVGNLPQAFVSLQNDKDRLPGYQWSLITGANGQACICVASADGNPLPTVIKWDVQDDDDDTMVSEFSEIDKEPGKTEEEMSFFESCIETLTGCNPLQWLKGRIRSCLTLQDCPAILGIYTVTFTRAGYQITAATGPTATITSTGIGVFTVNVPGAIAYDGIVIEPADNGNRDSITLRCIDSNGGFSVSEGDNGTAANIPRGNSAKITAYGTKTFITGIS